MNEYEFKKYKFFLKIKMIVYIFASTYLPRFPSEQRAQGKFFYFN